MTVLRSLDPPAPRYRLHGAFELLFAADGDVYLLRGGTHAEHVIRAPSAEDRVLLRQLAGTGIDLAPCSAVAARIAPLIAAGAVVPALRLERLAGTDATRFARQLPYLDDFGDPVELQRTLRASSVAIVGCGGLGAWALGGLASAGVGRFVLIDDDHVELRNLNRQMLYGSDDLGRPKVDRAAAWLARFDPTIAVAAVRQRVRGPHDLAQLGGCDALLLAADWPPFELARWTNEAATRQGVPYVMAGQRPPLVHVGPTFVPGAGACWACHEHELRQRLAHYDELAEHRRHEPTGAARLGPASALVGALLSLEVVHLLLGRRPVATHDRVLSIDIQTLESSWERVSRDPGCPHCAVDPWRPDGR